MTVTHINKLESHEVYTKLLSALGSENNPHQWLLFMAVMRQHLPFLMEKGKPTKTQYESSIIGGLGFASWKEMVESPLADGGLNWSINNWNKWSQAYNVVLNNPYLQDTNLTYVQILKLKSMFKDDFPVNAEDLEIAQVQLKKDLIQSKITVTSELEHRIAELEQQLVAANAQNEVLLLNAEKLNLVIDEVVMLKTENSILIHKNKDLSVAVDERDVLKAQVESVTWFDHLKAVLGL